MDLSKLKTFLNSEEGKRSLEEFFMENQRLESIKNAQLGRFHEKYHSAELFDGFVKRVISKYSSDKYYTRWASRGIEPPEDLYFFLYQYAEKYGRECSDAEWEKYGNMFTAGLHYVYGYYFNMMNGQGTVIRIDKEN